MASTRIRAAAFGISAASAFLAAAPAQVLPPVPDAAPKTPPYEPPPPPPEAPQVEPPPPPEPDTPDPDLVRRDANGAVLPLDYSAEEAACRAVAESFDPESRARFDAAVSWRRSVMEGVILQKTELVLKSRAALAVLDTAPIADIAPLATAARKELLVNPTFASFLQSRRAMTPRQVQQAQRVSRAYTMAANKDLQASAGPDDMSAVLDKSRRAALRNASLETMVTLDAMIDRLCANPAAISGVEGVSAGAIGALTAACATPGDNPGPRRDAVAAVLASLSLSEAQAVLRAVHVPYREEEPSADKPAAAAPTPPSGGSH